MTARAARRADHAVEQQRAAREYIAELERILARLDALIARMDYDDAVRWQREREREEGASRHAKGA